MNVRRYCRMHTSSHSSARLTLLMALLVIILAGSQTAFAQFTGELPFGKNKIQYQNFDWWYVQSDHFDVYYHDDGYYAALFTAHKAEQALAIIQDQLSFTITKRIAIIVYNSHNQFQQTNVIDQYMYEGIGGVTELFKNRVVIPFEGDYAKFAHVIHHELVHAVINDMFYGGSIQSLINNSGQAMLPLWMNEGFAEYSSVGGLDVKTDQFMRDVAVSEYLRGLNQLNGYFAYRGGQAFWSYVAAKYGPEKVGEVFNRFRVLRDVERTFQSCFGMSYEEMSEQWSKDEKKFYFPDVDRYDYVEDWAQRLTNHQKENNFYNTSPAISPDGTTIAFISDRGSGVFGLYTMDVKTRDVKKLVSSSQSTDFEQLNFLTPGISWDPTGRTIAIGGKAGGEDGIYLVDVVSGDYEVLTFGLQTIGGVSWSPNGRYIAFDAAQGAIQSDIYVYDLQTRSLSILTDDLFTDREPAWSPDSKWLYFISDRGEHLNGVYTPKDYSMWDHDVHQQDIYRVELQTKSIERITNDPSIGKYSIAVAPDHASLLYTADYNGITNIWELNLQTRQKVARSNSLQEVSQISITRDGTQLAFASQNRVGYDLFLLKFPFDAPTRDTLPRTKFRQQELDEQNSLAGILSDVNRPSSEPSAVGYGQFDILLADAAIVEPNEDINPDDVSGGGSPIARVDMEPREYRVSFTPDVITGNAGYSNWFGAQGTTQMLFSDMMGDHEIYFMANLFLDLTNSNFFLQYTYRPELIDWSVGGFHNAGYTFVNDPSLGGSYLARMRSYGGLVFGTYAFSRYSRLDAGLQIQAMSRDNIDVPTMPTLSRFVTMPSVSYVLDNTVGGLWAPIDGTRLNLTAEASPPIGGGGLSFATLRTDVRHYIHLGGSYSIAVRGSGGLSMGANPQKFFIGGVDNWFNRFFSDQGWPFQNPEDFAFIRPGFPVRGYALNERNGTQYVVANAELRFPLLFALQAGPIPALFQGLQGQIFFDMGGAWDQNGYAWTSRGGILFEATNPILYSTGIGIRSLALGLPLRFDIAWRQEPAGGFSAPVYLFSLGADF